MIEKKRVLEEMTGDDLLWHHQRGTSCCVMGCDEPVRYSELHRIRVGDRIAITYNFLCIADAINAVNSGKAIIEKQDESDVKVLNSCGVARARRERMIRQCGWCKRYLDWRSWALAMLRIRRLRTHGICKKCQGNIIV